jgi:phosphopantetheinyl transferase
LDGGSIPSPRPGGVGIDLAEPDAFEHLDATAIERAAHRWLSTAERAWCAAQPSFRPAMVTVLSCKESVFKASGGSAPLQEIVVTMDGAWPGGWALGDAGDLEPVTLWWEATPGHILTVGVAGAPDRARRLISRIICGRSGGDSA